LILSINKPHLSDQVGVLTLLKLSIGCSYASGFNFAVALAGTKIYHL
jgi:hypothetical protein